MADDERLSPFHVSLYLTLFQFWNLNRFKNPISIARQETMRLSKIGSVNTYIKCIKELDKWNYLKYAPSHNPLKGSLIYLYNFNNTTDNATDISPNKSSDKTDKQTNDNTPKQEVIPSINSINNTNKLNSVNDFPPTLKNNNLIIPKNEGENKRKKVAQKKVEGLPEIPRESLGKKYLIPTLEEIKNYFTGKLSSEFESEKFFNYFESNGWLVGGKTPMKNWQAAANNWLMNVSKFNNNGTNQQKNQSNNSAGKLHTNNSKNFSEPL